jgi:hypothetical protein
VTEEELDEYENGDRTRFGFLRALCSLKVEKSFEFHLAVHPEDAMFTHLGSEDWIGSQRIFLMEKYETLIRSLLRPDTLRNRVLSVEEEYVKSRKGEYGIGH